MWHDLERHFSTLGTHIDSANSFYIGDAAGRPALPPKKTRTWSGGNTKDFADSDRKFAFNANIKFQTPEEFFLDEPAEHFVYEGFDAVTWKNQAGFASGTPIAVEGSDVELVLMVGWPASGKTSFAKAFSERHGAPCLCNLVYVMSCVYMLFCVMSM